MRSNDKEALRYIAKLPHTDDAYTDVRLSYGLVRRIVAMFEEDERPVEKLDMVSGAEYRSLEEEHEKALEELKKARNAIMEVLGYGCDEEAWPPGMEYADALISTKRGRLMFFKFIWSKAGRHVHAKVFSAPRPNETYACLGTLVMSSTEWEAFHAGLRIHNCSVEFVEEKSD